MKRVPRRDSQRREPTYPRPTVSELTLVEKNRKPIPGLDAAKMQILAHNAVMWCDRGGIVLGKESNPFSASLDMEARGVDTEARFEFHTSPYSNGNLSVHVWYRGVLVFSATDTPGAVYNYPSAKIQVTTYTPGAWEQFLLNKGFHK